MQAQPQTKPSPQVSTSQASPSLAADAAGKSTQAVGVAMKPEEPDPIVPLEPALMRLAENARNVWRIDVSPTLKPEDLLEASYWSNVGFQMRHGDIVEAETEDRSWYAEYLVADAGKNWARLAIKSIVKMDAKAPGIQDRLLAGYDIQWGGNVAKWRVVRLADKKVIQDKFESRAACEWFFTQWGQSQMR